jgi:hypothetical protein
MNNKVINAHSIIIIIIIISKHRAQWPTSLNSDQVWKIDSQRRDGTLATAGELTPVRVRSATTGRSKLLKRLRKKQGCCTPGSRDVHWKGHKGLNTVFVFVLPRSSESLLPSNTVFWNVTPFCSVKKWRKKVPAKIKLLSSKLHGVTFQKTAILIFTAQTSI